METGLIDSEFFKWVVLPVLIFIARMSDVTLGTLRNVFISKGFRNIVPLIGFFEVLIWLISIRQIMHHLDNPLCYIGFAGGFAAGTYVGMLIEGRLALGLQVIRIITHQNSEGLIQALKAENIGITILDGQGAKGPVKIVFTIVKRKDIDTIKGIIQTFNPSAFYSIEDIRLANQGVFPKKKAISGAMEHLRSIFPDAREK